MSVGESDSAWDEEQDPVVWYQVFQAIKEEPRKTQYSVINFYNLFVEVDTMWCEIVFL